MLVSKLFKGTFFSNTKGLRYLFAEAPSRVNPLQFKILEAKNLNEFLSIYDENKTEFTADLFSFAQKSLSVLLKGLKLRLDQPQFQDYVKQILTIKVENLSPRQSINLLGTLRSLSNKGIYSHDREVIDFKRKLTHFFIKNFTEKPQTNDINTLSLYYFELASADQGTNGSNFIAQKVLDLFAEDEKKFGKLNITTSQIQFLLHGLSLSEGLHSSELRMRHLLIKKLNSELEGVKLKDLVQIAISLNAMDQCRWEQFQSAIVMKVYRQVLLNTNDLEAPSVFQLLRVKKTRNHILQQIYDEMFKNILSEIKENGQTSVSEHMIMNIFVGLSNFVQLNQASDVSQGKFFAFLEVYARFCKEEHGENDTQFSTKLEEMFSNSFFYYTHSERILKLIEKTKIPMTLPCIYALSIRKYNVSAFIEAYNYENIKPKSDYFVKWAVCVNNQLDLQKQNEKLKKLVEVANKLADQMFVSKQIFSKTFMALLKKQKTKDSLTHFHSLYHEKFGTLPNPFQQNKKDENTNSVEEKGENDNYAYCYLFYVFTAFKTREIYSFLDKSEKFINDGLLISSIRRHLQTEKILIVPKSWFLSMVLKRIKAAIETKNKTFVRIALELVNKYSEQLSMRKFPENAEISIWKILHILIKNYAAISEMGVKFQINHTLENYLSKQYKNYSIDQSFRKFISHLIVDLPKFIGASSILRLAITHALNLNILTKDHILKLKIGEFALPIHLQKRLHSINDEKYVPVIEKLTRESLVILLSNPNSSELVKNNFQRINDLINNMYPRDLALLLVTFKITRGSSTFSLIKQIINNLNEKIKNFQKIDLFGIFTNLKRNQYGNAAIVKKLAEKAAEFYKDRLDYYSYDSHAELIRHFSEISSLDIKEYAQKIVQRIQNDKDYVGDNHKVKIYNSLLLTNYTFNEKIFKFLEKITPRFPKTALTWFLLFENELNAEFKQKNLPIICKQLLENQKKNQETANKRSVRAQKEQVKGQQGEDKKQFQIEPEVEKEKEEIFTLSRVYYNYIKLRYPQETKELNIEDQLLSEFKFAYSAPQSFISYFNHIAKATNNTMAEVTFDKINVGYTIGKYLFINPSIRRPNAVLEPALSKRIIQTLPAAANFQVVILSLGNRSVESVIATVKNSCKDLLTDEQCQNILKEIQDERAKTKTDSESVVEAEK